MPSAWLLLAFTLALTLLPDIGADQCNKQLQAAHKVSDQMDRLVSWGNVWHNIWADCDEDMRVYALGKIQTYFSGTAFDRQSINNQVLKKIIKSDDMIHMLTLFEGDASGSIRGAFFANAALDIIRDSMKASNRMALLSIDTCSMADLDNPSRILKIAKYPASRWLKVGNLCDVTGHTVCSVCAYKRAIIVGEKDFRFQSSQNTIDLIIRSLRLLTFAYRRNGNLSDAIVTQEKVIAIMEALRARNKTTLANFCSDSLILAKLMTEKASLRILNARVRSRSKNMLLLSKASKILQGCEKQLKVAISNSMQKTKEMLLLAKIDIANANVNYRQFSIRGGKIRHEKSRKYFQEAQNKVKLLSAGGHPNANAQSLLMSGLTGFLYLNSNMHLMKKREEVIEHERKSWIKVIPIRKDQSMWNSPSIKRAMLEYTLAIMPLWLREYISFAQRILSTRGVIVSHRILCPTVTSNIQCFNIDVLHVKSRDDFNNLTSHFNKGIPVLIAHRGKHINRLSNAWERSQILKKYGSMKIVTSDRPYANIYGSSYKLTNLSDHIYNMRSSSSYSRYMFQPIAIYDQNHGRQILEEYLPLHNMLTGNFSNTRSPSWNAKAEFYIGGSGTSTHFHKHASTINTLIYGAKLWFIIPPTRLNYGRIGEDIKRWIHNPENMQGDELIIMVQPPSSTIYIPSGWAHGVINIAEVVGINVQIG